MRATVIGLIVSIGMPAMAAAQGPAAQAAPQPAAPVTKAAIKDSVVLENHGYTYNADGRRDPFVSLAKRGAGSDQPAVARAAGLVGLGAGEVTLRGTLQSNGGYVGILQGADNRTYIVRAGARLADGTIRSITPEAMVILQQVNDPLSPQKQREVRKMLRQTEEAK